MNVFDTIAAVSTPRGKGGIAVIRVSGADAVSVAEKVFFPKNRRMLSEIEHARSVYGDIRAKDVDGKIINIDDGMAVVFRAPRSFTGEDTVEISCHGGVLITEAVLEAVFAAGARPAAAGEFTRRAFISGRMSLTQAQSLGDLLEAKTHNQMLLSRTGVSGVLSDKIEELYTQLSDVLSSIYAKIDFPDEDLSDMSREEIVSTLVRVKGSVDSLAATYKTGRSVSEGIKTVICGRTNAGKSSLYNRIVGRDAAIVTDIEGTTRDLLVETVPFGRVTLRLCDTAGLRQTSDAVESIGVERARKEIADAELILAVFDGSRQPDDEDRELIAELLSSSACVLTVLNKCDAWSGESEMSKLVLKSGFENVVSVSTLNGEGIDKLAELVDEKFTDGALDLRYDAVVADARQYAALVRASDELMTVISQLSDGFELDVCCIDAESAMAALGEINGHHVNEDIVSSIFHKFCVGK